MSYYNSKNNIDWQDELEWEPIDSTPEMVLGDPILQQQKKLREERQKVEESDHKLTEELFHTPTPIIDYNVIIDNKFIESFRNTGNNVVKKIKRSGKNILDKVVVKSKR